MRHHDATALRPAAAPAPVIPAGGLAPLAGQRAVLLTTYRRDGTPVGTPVHVVVETSAGERAAVAYVRTFEPSGKMKRLRRRTEVEVAPCTLRGRVTGPSVPARARILTGAESRAAGRRLAARHPLAHGHLIPWYHRRTGRTTVHLELTAR
jgi:PPOX class probable F420-dependent enzyme